MFLNRLEMLMKPFPFLIHLVNIYWALVTCQILCKEWEVIVKKSILLALLELKMQWKVCNIF